MGILNQFGVSIFDMNTQGQSFIVRLSEHEWNEDLRGWHCPALKIPGTIVEHVLIKGQRIGQDDYRVDQANEFIHWVRETPPQELSIAVSIKMTANLSTEAETQKWKTSALLLPVATLLLSSPLLVAGFQYLTREPTRNDNQKVNSNANNANASICPSPCASPTHSCPGPWGIVLETITPKDGGREAALKQLSSKATSKGYDKNSALFLKYGVYRVIIYFDSWNEANSNMEKAQTINKTVDGVIDLSQECVKCELTAPQIYTCLSESR